MKISLSLQNLKCGGCKTTIDNKLQTISGIKILQITPENGTVEIEYTQEAALAETLEQLNQLGYPILGSSNTLTKQLKSYVSCALGKIQS